MSENATRTGIRIHTKVFPLAFLLLFFRTNITIDEVTTSVRWGTSFHAVEPGRHRVSVSFRYLLGRNMGENGVTIDVSDGQTVNVEYRSPFLVTGTGLISAGNT